MVLEGMLYLENSYSWVVLCMEKMSTIILSQIEMQGICMQCIHLLRWQGERAPSYGEASWLRKWVRVYRVRITNRIVLETRILVCKIWDDSQQTSNTRGGWREPCTWKKETTTTELEALLNSDYWCSNPQHKIFQVTESAYEQIFVGIFFHTGKDHRSFFSELKFNFWGKDNLDWKKPAKKFQWGLTTTLI